MSRPIPCFRPGLIVFGAFYIIAGLGFNTNAAAVQPDPPVERSQPTQAPRASLQIHYLRTEQDAQGPFKVYEVVAPVPRWAAGGVGSNHTTVRIIKTGLEVSFMLGSDPKTRYRQIEDIPFDTKNLVISYDLGKVTFEDGSKHKYILESEKTGSAGQFLMEAH